MSADVAILVPVLGRPQSVEPLLASIDGSTRVDHRVLFLASPGDEAVIAELERAGAEYHVAGWPPEIGGDYARKINLGVRLTTEPVIVTAAGDVSFLPDWYEEAVALLTGRVMVVGTNDLCNPRVMSGEHATHFVVLREYPLQFGTIDEPQSGMLMHEGYPHEYVDDEFIGTARFRRRYRFAPNSCIEHLHPMCAKGENDEMYEQQGARMQRGAKTYRRRRRQWMGRRSD